MEVFLPRPPNAPSLLRARDREVRAVAMRMEGHPWRVIAAKLGLSVEGAGAAWRRGLAKAAPVDAATLAEGNRVETDRLDALLQSLWPRAIGGDDAAVDRVLKIAERRARLCGLDSVTRTEVSVLTWVDLIRAAERADVCGRTGDGDDDDDGA